MYCLTSRRVCVLARGQLATCLTDVLASWQAALASGVLERWTLLDWQVLGCLEMDTHVRIRGKVAEARKKHMCVEFYC